MRYWHPFGLGFATLASVGAAQTGDSITREEALRLPPDQVAERVLGQIARNVTSITRPDYVSPFFPDLPLTQLALATSPVSSPYPGLCQTTVLHIMFFDGLPAAPRERNQPVRAQRLTTEERYRVVGEVVLPYNLSTEDQRRQDSQCAGLYPIIPPGEERLGSRSFFGFRGGLGPQYGVAILQQVVRGVREGNYTDHRCTGHERCRDSSALLRGLSFDELLSVRIDRDPTNPTSYTVVADFLVSGTDDTLVTDEVTVRAELEHPSPRLVQSLGATTIRRVAIIRD